MATSLGLAALLAITLTGLVAWLYRRGKISAGYRATRDELNKIGKIQNENRRIDEKTRKKLDEVTDGRGLGARRYWLRDD